MLIYDDLSRPGVERNLAWLRESHGERLHVEIADMRNREALRAAVRSAEQVFHFAAQVAVTTSLTDPVARFRSQRGRHAQPAGGDPRGGILRRRWCSRPPTKCTADFRTWRWRRTARATSRWTRPCARASAKTGRWIFTVRTDARKARRTSTCSIMRAPSGCPRWCSA